jgi:Na+/melibiose symporter-like transporter
MLMTLVSYYATGVIGIAVVLVGILLTSMRIWDAVTDPVIAMMVDKTRGRFGKYRPFIAIGNAGMAVSIALLFFTTHKLPQAGRLPYFLFLYVVYIIFYTMQTTIHKAAQTSLTKDPKQRPMYGLYNTILSMVVMSTAFSYYLSNVVIKKYPGGFRNVGLFGELTVIIIIASAFCAVLQIIGIWEKDRPEFWDTDKKATDTLKFRDYWDILTHNRAIQMMIIESTSDKLAAQIAGHTSVSIILYGILAGNYGLLGQISPIVLVPVLLLAFFGTGMARRSGLRQGIVFFSWIGIIVNTVLGFVIFFGNMSSLSISSINLFTIFWIIILVLQQGARQFCSDLSYPLIGDITDYETYRSGRFVPGMIGNLYSFVDKMVSSLATTIAGFILAGFGYTATLPQVGDDPSTTVKTIVIIFLCAFPVFGYALNVISMKFYPLTAEKMEEIQRVLAERKAAKEKAV